MMQSAEAVFGKTGILIQLPGLCDPELAMILPFLENIKSLNVMETQYLNKMTFPSKWNNVHIATMCPSLGLEKNLPRGSSEEENISLPNFKTETYRDKQGKKEQGYLGKREAYQLPAKL